MEIDALVIAPHPDDAELGMGATMAALIAQGAKLALVDLCDGEPTPHGSPEIRAAESAQASKALGLTKRVNLGLRNREIFDDVPSRKKLASVFRELRPRLLFAPYSEDGHPDHIQAHQLAVASRFYSKFVKSDMPHDPHHPARIIFYSCSHIRWRMQPSFVFDVSDTFETKIAAVKAYRSQFEANSKNQGIFDLLRAEASYWGSQIGARYGEPFFSKENLRVAGKSALFEI